MFALTIISCHNSIRNNIYVRSVSSMALVNQTHLRIQCEHACNIEDYLGSLVLLKLYLFYIIPTDLKWDHGNLGAKDCANTVRESLLQGPWMQPKEGMRNKCKERLKQLAEGHVAGQWQIINQICWDLGECPACWTALPLCQISCDALCCQGQLAIFFPGDGSPSERAMRSGECGRCHYCFH